VGKSTLAKVIVGVWPVQGDVHWGGVPVQRWDSLGLRESIGYLPQDVVLMEGSVAENIGRFEENNHEKIVEAAKAAGVHEMILRLSQGYDSAVGEGGGYLSAGQRQRLALARALYGGARLLVLDEPNASLDPAGEEALGRALLHVKSQGAIVIVITHREGLLRFCDAVLDLGQWLRPQAN
jgi:ATP-binding cassette subfamily C exporter for protease/lipase